MPAKPLIFNVSSYISAGNDGKRIGILIVALQCQSATLAQVFKRIPLDVWEKCLKRLLYLMMLVTMILSRTGVNATNYSKIKHLKL